MAPYQANYYPMQGYQMPVYPGQAQPMDNLAQLRQQQQQPMLLGRAVSDVAEARAVPSDLGGQPMFFPDLSHNAIHMKVFNPQTGAGDFYTFTLAQPAQAAQKPVQRPAAAQVRYALAEDLEAIQGQIQGIREDVSRLMSREQEVGGDV